MNKYNVLYIHTHDSGQIFSPYGYEVPTDGLKQFSEDATIFTNAFCASPTCSPSRSALVTGCYPHQNGMMGLGNRGFCLNDYNEHMVHLFNTQDYITVLCGIQHEYGRYSEHQSGAARIGYSQDISADCSKYSEKEMVEWDTQNVAHFTQWLSSYNTEHPFFLSFGFFSTHREYPDLTEEELEQEVSLPSFLKDCPEVRTDYKGHMKSLKLFDEKFSHIIQALKEKGIYENTIILFTTDHGIAFPRAKCTLYDAGIKVALIMRVPGKQQGQTVDGLISHVDILPTLCQLLGIPLKRSVSGIDFSPVFDNPNAEIRDEIFAEVNFHTSYEPIRCVRTERHKYIQYFDTNYLKPNLSNIDTSVSKRLYMNTGLINESKEEEQFYDLQADPMETVNLIHSPSHQTDIATLKHKLSQIMQETNDPLLDGPIPNKKQWIVNTNECINPKSKELKDFK